MKPLGVVWGKYEELYSRKNTIMFDDIGRNFLMNPQNGLKVIQPLHLPPSWVGRTGGRPESHHYESYEVWPTTLSQHHSACGRLNTIQSIVYRI